jgi:uncharacterized membrane protein YtjA (UPF0391 family)
METRFGRKSEYLAGPARLVFMFRLALVFCMLSAGAALLGFNGVAAHAAIAAAALFSLAGLVFAVIALSVALTNRPHRWFPDPD